MRNKKLTKLMALVLALIMVCSSLVGCTTQEQEQSNTLSAESSTIKAETNDTQENSSSVAQTAEPSVESCEDEVQKAEVESRKAEESRRAEEEARKKAEEEAREAEEKARKKAEEERILAEQMNSFSMMYYLAITAEEIRTSKDNRIALEDIYTSLLNDINPGAIDEITQDHLKNLRDIIKSYLSISVKRERLQFIYNQQKAAAIKSAVPNPLAILSVANSFDWRKLAMSVVYTAVDSYNNYKKAGESADMAFIMSGWELDDEEKDIVMKNRDRAFDYMVDMVQEYDLDGLKTLSEKAIERFAEICATENASERIKLLRADEPSYELLGNYWLELANAYFETSQYAKCLDCVSRYNELSTGIYRKDYNYLRILPKAVVAAQKTYSGEKYIIVTSEFADAIIYNTTTDDWSSRYFATQVYLDLYSKTNDKVYIEKAYKIISENVTTLLKEQRSINSTYLNPIVEQTATEPDYRYMTEDEKKTAKKEFKKEKDRVKTYNKALKESRKTELLTLYEPLIVNCELLFALADQLDIDKFEMADIEAILQTDSNGVFLVKPINDMYSFAQKDNTNSIDFQKDEIIVPAYLLTAESTIVVTVKQSGETFTFDDCIVDEVKRQGSTIDTFFAHIISKQLKKHKWAADSKITVEITYGDAYGKTVNFDFVVSEYAAHWYGDKVVFKAQ